MEISGEEMKKLHHQDYQESEKRKDGSSCFDVEEKVLTWTKLSKHLRHDKEGNTGVVA